MVRNEKEEKKTRVEDDVFLYCLVDEVQIMKKMADVSHVGFCSEFRVFVRPPDVGPNELRFASLRLAVVLFCLWHTHAGWPSAVRKVSSITDTASTTERNEAESNSTSVEINLFPPYRRTLTTTYTI